MVYTLLQPSKSHWWIRRFFRSGESERGRRGVADLRRGGRDGCEWRLPPPTDTHTPGCPPRGRGWHSLSLQVLEGRRAALRGAVLAVTRHVHGVHGARVHFHWGGWERKAIEEQGVDSFWGAGEQSSGTDIANLPEKPPHRRAQPTPPQPTSIWGGTEATPVLWGFGTGLLGECEDTASFPKQGTSRAPRPRGMGSRWGLKAELGGTGRQAASSTSPSPAQHRRTARAGLPPGFCCATLGPGGTFWR